MYPFIEAEKAGQGNVKRSCNLLEVSTTAYYDWARHVPTKRQISDDNLLEKIKVIHETSKQTYGSPRVHRQLKNDGECVGEKRIARLMQTNGIVGRTKRRFKRTTIPDSDKIPAAVDLVKRIFGPETLELNRLYAGDITYIRTWEGWLYLAAVIDVASRKVVGWAMADHMRAELVCDALSMAVGNRQPQADLIFHSDRGSQYTSDEFTSLLERHVMIQSLSRPGQCWDNAVAESFFATLKCELIHGNVWPTRAHARRAIVEYVEGWYNQRRLHSSLGYRSPEAYESIQHAEKEIAA